MKKKSPVEFKGNVNGLYLTVNEEIAFDILMTSLKELLDKSADFYRGSSIVACMGKAFTYREKADMADLIGSYDISVVSLEPLQAKAAPVKVEPPQVIEREIVVEKEVIKSDTQFIYGTMRSGKRIDYPGHVLVFGDVNPGAEIIAGGNIVILGKLKGFVHAGAYGNEDAIVVANYFAPTQIRISGFISVPPQDEKHEQVLHTEKAYVSNGIIKIEAIH